MSSRLRTLLAQLGVLALLVAALFALPVPHFDEPVDVGAKSAVASVAATSATSSSASPSSATAPLSTSSITASSIQATTSEKTAQNKGNSTSSTSTAPENEVSRLRDPYQTIPLSIAQVNDMTRAAVVNILCTPRTPGVLSSVTASGVIVDPRGIILTNAHVAQYVLLSEGQRIDLQCFIRTGSPAVAKWRAEVLYIPSIWVQNHAQEINSGKVPGTGEHDYALLFITSSVDGSPLPADFPYLSPDTREGVAFTGDNVLVGGYPAEFLGALATSFTFYPVTSETRIGSLLTFSTNSIDLLSLGGVIEAQSGSSGGAAVNPWGRLVGILVTTSAGASTAERDLHALTLSYINSDMAALTGRDLLSYLNGDVALLTDDFTRNVAPGLIDLYIKYLGAH